MIELIKNNIDNIKLRIENIYKIKKIKSLFETFGDINIILGIKETIDKIKEQIEENINKTKNYNIGLLEKIFFNKEISKEEYSEITNINFKINDIKKINEIMENNINQFKVYYKLDLKKIEEYNKNIRGEFKDENNIVYIYEDEIAEADRKIQIHKFELLSKIFINNDYPDYELKEVVIEKGKLIERIRDLFKLDIDGEEKWYYEQKGGSSYEEIRKELEELKEELRKIENNFIELNVLTSELVLYLLLIRSIRIYKFNSFERIERYITYDDLLKFRDIYFENLKISDTDIFKNRISQLLDCIINNMEKTDKNNIDVYKSNNIDLVILSVLIKKN
jgi:hypothetical protein